MLVSVVDCLTTPSDYSLAAGFLKENPAADRTCRLIRPKRTGLCLSGTDSSEVLKNLGLNSPDEEYGFTCLEPAFIGEVGIRGLVPS